VGFPVTPLEPMAGGLPIIATAVPGIAEIIADETPLPGIIVPVADVSALVSALERLLNDIEPSQLKEHIYVISTQCLLAAHR
jgi:glycosyltransferase involved in cell wall biosynthesis